MSVVILDLSSFVVRVPWDAEVGAELAAKRSCVPMVPPRSLERSEPERSTVCRESSDRRREFRFTRSEFENLRKCETWYRN